MDHLSKLKYLYTTRSKSISANVQARFSDNNRCALRHEFA